MLAENIFGDEVDGGSPILAVFGVFAYGIMANICYTGGWITELVAKYVWKDQAENLGKITFTLGIVFSVIITLLPVGFYLLLVVLKILVPK